MRIIAGEYRGRRVLPPQGAVTRPITDRVKQSLFDILTPRLEGSVVWDLFAGTGSMGLESLSRGASRAVFFEADRGAVNRLRQNIQSLSIDRDRPIVHATDLFKWFNSWEKPHSGAGSPPSKADLVFLDPPYRFLSDRPDDLCRLGRQLSQHHLNPDGTVIFRHDARDTLELPGLTQYDCRTYGGMSLEFLVRSAGFSPYLKQTDSKNTG